MKNVKSGSFATAKLQSARRGAVIFAIAMITVIGFSMTACSIIGIGTFKLTDIPAKSNGKYAIVYAFKTDASLVLIGVQAVNNSAKSVTLSGISNGSVDIPMWKVNNNNKSMTRYFGNDTVDAIVVGIHDSKNINSTDPAVIIAGMAGATSFIGATKFSNGGAAKDWKEGMGGGLFGGKSLGNMLKGLKF
jgi:hypothetical protein